MSRRKPQAIRNIKSTRLGAPRARHDAWPAVDLVSCMAQCGVTLPEELVSVEVKVSADSLTQIVYTCNVTGTLEHKIGKAMQLHAVKERLAKA